MCGRMTLTRSAEEIADYFAAAMPGTLAVTSLAGPGGGGLMPRYNIAPSQPVLTIAPAPGDPGRACFDWRRWGLLPSWAKDPAISQRLFNARSETVAEKPSFRAAFRRRRCLVVADGFYEWSPRDRGHRPYHFAPKDAPLLALAGLYESWRPSSGAAPSIPAPIESCTVLTTEANADLAGVHHRMPVILSPDDFETWIAHETPVDTLHAMTHRPAAGTLARREVGRYVNDPRHDDPGCLAAAATGSAPSVATAQTQGSLFDLDDSGERSGSARGRGRTPLPEDEF